MQADERTPYRGRFLLDVPVLISQIDFLLQGGLQCFVICVKKEMR